ncbi:hypothetical protein [Microbacterium halophytorum]|uniref:hypothetical protein n=1 Tax=Microbacterium halophytorum TaxID=2067568 RepID=UPI001E4685D2|nr:hypothetical protein [Microbacterium halophytorum]
MSDNTYGQPGQPGAPQHAPTPPQQGWGAPHGWGAPPAAAPQQSAWGAPQQAPAAQTGWGAPGEPQGAQPGWGAPHGDPYAGRQSFLPQQQPAPQQKPKPAPLRPGDGVPAVWAFTLRELILASVGLLSVVFSFFSIYAFDGGDFAFTAPQIYLPIWNQGLVAVAAAIAMVAATALVILRRFVPAVATLRIGSLGIDQFASVAFSLYALAYWGAMLSVLLTSGGVGAHITWTAWIAGILAIAGVFFTVVAPFVPPFRGDFDAREETPAVRAARPAPRLVRAPKPEQPNPYGPQGWAPQGQPVQGQSAPQGPTAGQQFAAQAPATEAAPVVGADQPPTAGPAQPAPEPEPAAEAPETAPGAALSAPEDDGIDGDTVLREDDATRANVVLDAQDAAAEPSAAAFDPQSLPVTNAQPFWALAPEERDAVDAAGEPVFRIGPTAWALVLEERGDVFVVRHDDGRIGYLHDTSGITRG